MLYFCIWYIWRRLAIFFVSFNSVQLKFATLYDGWNKRVKSQWGEQGIIWITPNINNGTCVHFSCVLLKIVSPKKLTTNMLSLFKLQSTLTSRSLAPFDGNKKAPYKIWIKCQSKLVFTVYAMVIWVILLFYF